MKISYLVGIVSSGAGNDGRCAMLNNPGIYTRIKGFLSWIKKIVKDGHCGKENKRRDKKHKRRKKKQMS